MIYAITSFFSSIIFNINSLLIQNPPWRNNRYNGSYWYEDWVKALIYILIILFIIKLIKWRRPDYHSHWNTLIDNFHFSSYDFYERLKVELDKKRISGLRVQTVKLKEGNLISDRRLYLRLEWRDFQYDICAAPFSTGFFVSWWLIDHIPIHFTLINKIPYLGSKLVRLLFPVTYYKIDTASMFMTYVHSCIQKVIKDITEEKGVRGLTELQSQPILNNIFKR